MSLNYSAKRNMKFCRDQQHQCAPGTIHAILKIRKRIARLRDAENVSLCPSRRALTDSRQIGECGQLLVMTDSEMKPHSGNNQTREISDT